MAIARKAHMNMASSLAHWLFREFSASIQLEHKAAKVESKKLFAHPFEI